MSLKGRWEGPAALACVLLSFVPVLRVPAGLLLLCFLPGAAIARHRLGERSAARIAILGGLLSLVVIPAVAIPAALLSGRPVHLTSVALAAAICFAASIRSRQPAPQSEAAALTRSGHLQLVLIVALILIRQVGFTLAKHPDENTIRWKGTPDLMFFRGIYTQLTLHTPPLDPENGSELLVHNWIYHFHFALTQMVTDLSIPAMQRTVSAWMAITLLGLVYLIAADLFRRPSAGLVASLFLMTGGEIYWLARSLLHLQWDPRALPWAQHPFGITLLFGWYNLAPLAAALGAWYWFEKHRTSSDRAALAASLAMCAALAFFHPIFFGVFMIGFCLWMARLWLSQGRPAGWLAYLATPLPFFVFYKLPYYGWANPPSVIHPMPPAGMWPHAQDLLLAWGVMLVMGLVGLIAAGGALGPLPWLVGVATLLNLLVEAPNPHWFNDLSYVALGLAAGVGGAWLWQRRGAAGRALLAGCLAISCVSFGLHLQKAVGALYTFSEGEQAAARWIRAHTGPDDLVAILPNSPSSYTVLGLAGRRVVHGWTGHLLDFHDYARDQEQEIRQMYASGDPDRAAQVARRHRVSLVYVGRTESAATDRRGLAEPCFRVVFSAPDVELLSFTCRDDEAAGTPAGS